jgi:hypothetical protein
MALAVVCASGASAASAPATQSQVLQLVHNSSRIHALDSQLQKSLLHAGGDFSWSHYPEKGVLGGFCESLTACVYGDVHAQRSIVLFGDSHALMWLPALAPYANAHHFQLRLAWQGLCSPAKLNLYYLKVGDPKNCNTFRANIVREIRALHPALVVLAARNTLIPASRTKFFTDAQWAAGYETTIAAIKTKLTRVTLIEDSVTFDSPVPGCLAIHVASIQKCSVKDPNWLAPALTAGEASAARHEDITYIRTHQWLCTRRCSPVIGNFIVYQDADHLSFSYTSYLSGVLGHQIDLVLSH